MRERERERERVRESKRERVYATYGVCFVALLFLGKLEQEVNQYFVQILSLVTDNNLS